MGLKAFEFAYRIVLEKRPVFPSDLDKAWQNQINHSRQEGVMSALSFREIVDRLGSNEFISHEINIDCFHPCESCILVAQQRSQHHEMGKRNDRESSGDEKNANTEAVLITGNSAHSQHACNFAISISGNSRLKPGPTPTF
jgi:hypothetical protein